MAVTKAKKQEILKQLEDKFSKAKAVYFADYRGINVKNISQLRRTMRAEGVDYIVAKKTLMRLAAKKNNLPEISDDILAGPVAAAIGYDDIVTPSKLLHEFSKTNESLKLLGGLVEGKLISAAEALKMATLPSKNQLIAQFIGSLKSPISGFHGVLHGVLSKFIRTLDAVKTKQS